MQDNSHSMCTCMFIYVYVCLGQPLLLRTRLYASIIHQPYDPTHTQTSSTSDLSGNMRNQCVPATSTSIMSA